MPNYSASGTENLRANPNIYTSQSPESPSGNGKDAGGTTNLGSSPQTFQAGTGKSANNASSPPSPPQSFNDDTV